MKPTWKPTQTLRMMNKTPAQFVTGRRIHHHCHSTPRPAVLHPIAWSSAQLGRTQLKLHGASVLHVSHTRSLSAQLHS